MPARCTLVLVASLGNLPLIASAQKHGLDPASADLQNLPGQAGKRLT